MCCRNLLLLFLSWTLLGAGPAIADDAPSGAWARFAGFDQDGDGTVEIDSVRSLHAAGTGRRGVLVLVEPRLLEPLDSAPDLRASLKRLADDLAAEGCRAEVLSVTLSRGTGHRDGRLVLALRELLRAAHAGQGLEAALLVGRFPDAMLVRTCNWRKHGKVVLRKGKPDVAVFAKVPYLRRIPELVAHRAEIVLSDLDGRWEDTYTQAPTRLPSIQAVYPDGVPARGGPCADHEAGGVLFEDFFHVEDGAAELQLSSDGGASLVLDDAVGDPEVAASDGERPNVIARPEIVVSRIDGRGVALRPRSDVVGVEGEDLLDAEGRPQAVRFASSDDVPHWRDGLWEEDPLLERRLLAEFLDRDHAYRTGAASVAWRPASLACGLGSGYRVMRRAADDWDDAGEGADVHGRPTLADVAAWFRYPAVLRTLRGHSDPWGCAFSKKGLAGLLDGIEGASWSWTPRGDALVPSLEAACRGGNLDWFLLRTLYENGAVAPGPAFYHHTGCEGISPPSARRRPYDHAAYGRRQGAEALLFFGNGLALVGRAKVFYDEPRGFTEALAEGESFGAAWARYFEIESRAASWSKAGGNIGRKRSYFWSVLGDATLRLRRSPPR